MSRKISRRKRSSISKGELDNVVHLPQQQAAKIIGVSITTLKKRFHELYPQGCRWPYKPYDLYKEKARRIENQGVDERMTIQHITNKKSMNPTEKTKRMWKNHFEDLGFIKKVDDDLEFDDFEIEEEHGESDNSSFDDFV